MAEVRMNFNMAMVLAVVIAEVVSLVWYNHYSPWHHRFGGERYLITAIVADCVLVYIIKYVKDKLWQPRGWEDAAILSMWMALLYFGFQAPHVVYDTYTFTYFLYHVVHKFIFTFVVIFILEHFKRY